MSEIYRSEAGRQLLGRNYRAALESWPVDNEHLRLPTPEGETFVVASGPDHAPPLVLIHGSGSNVTQWLDRIANLAEHFRVYAVDVIGEPGFSAPSRPSPASDRYAVWMDAVLDALGLHGPVPIMGISLGSWLALDYATRRPDRVQRLALSCPPGLGPPKKGYLLKAVLLSPFGRWGRRRVVAGMLGPGLAGMGPAGADAVVEQVQLVSANFRYRPGDLPVFDDDALRRLTMPVHVLVGEADVMWDAAVTKQRLEALAPRATVQMLPGVGHLVPARTAADLEFLTGP
ncbi:MAG: alpha/beta hydrolase [Pseudonocardia sp.]|nr:alpha/beta hydrolase [Pseudonocardia sp.]